MSATVISVPLTIEPEGYADIEACIGESIAVTSGTYQLVLTDRDTQFLFHANAVNGRAIGVESGDEYRVIGHQQEVAVAKSTGAIIDVFELRLRVIGTAGATSFHAHIYFHLTIRPDGEIVVERGDWVTTC